MRRCPKSQITPEAWQAIQWWIDWKTLGCLPWGGDDVMDQPMFVYETLRLCEETKDELSRETPDG